MPYNFNNKEYQQHLNGMIAQIPNQLMRLILIARDEDPKFYTFATLQEAVEALNSNKELKERVMKRLHHE